MSTVLALTPREEQLLAFLTEKAETGGVCPGLGQLAAKIGVSQVTVAALLKRLGQAGYLTWRIKWRGTGVGNVRVVRITATGKETATPPRARVRADSGRGKSKIAPIPVFAPTENGCPVKVLTGAEFQFWKAHYEAREAAAARKAVHA